MKVSGLKKNNDKPLCGPLNVDELGPEVRAHFSLGPITTFQSQRENSKVHLMLIKRNFYK